MYNFKRQPKPLYTTSYGDPGVYGEHVHYLKNLDLKQYRERQLIKLQAAGNWNQWDALRLLGFNVDPLIQLATYDCPLTKRDYVALLPIYLVTDDLTIEKGKVKDCKYPVDSFGWLRDMSCDSEWSRERDFEGADDEGELRNAKDQVILEYLANRWASGTLTTLLMGSGYTDMVMPNDGGWSIAPVMIEVEDSNDVVIAITFDWHNK